jgi:hypothetical protein
LQDFIEGATTNSQVLVPADIGILIVNLSMEVNPSQPDNSELAVIIILLPVRNC